jgi:hypothetical protein
VLCDEGLVLDDVEVVSQAYDVNITFKVGCDYELISV